MDEKTKQNMIQQAVYELAPRIEAINIDDPEQLDIADTEENNATLNGAFLALKSLGVEPDELRNAVIRQKIADRDEPDHNDGMDDYLRDEEQRKRMDNGDGPRS